MTWFFLALALSASQSKKTLRTPMANNDAGAFIEVCETNDNPCGGRMLISTSSIIALYSGRYCGAAYTQVEVAQGRYHCLEVPFQEFRKLGLHQENKK